MAKNNSSTDLVQHSFNNFNIFQRQSDGYLFATDMCKASGKLFGNYRKNETTTEYLKALEADIRIRISDLIQVFKGGNSFQGTWIHPKVAIHLAMWLSPQFAVQVTSWVYDWMSGLSSNPVQQELLSQNSIQAIKPEIAIHNFPSNLSQEQTQHIVTYAERIAEGKTPLKQLPPMLDCDVLTIQYRDHTLAVHRIHQQIYLPIIQLCRIMDIDYSHQKRFISKKSSYQSYVHSFGHHNNLFCLPFDQAVVWMENIKVAALHRGKHANAIRVQIELPTIIEDAIQKLNALQDYAIDVPQLCDIPEQTEADLIKALEEIKGEKVTVIADSTMKGIVQAYKNFDDQVMPFKRNLTNFMYKLTMSEVSQ